MNRTSVTTIREDQLFHISISLFDTEKLFASVSLWEGSPSVTGGNNWSMSEQTVEQTFELSVIWCVMKLMQRYYTDIMIS